MTFVTKKALPRRTFLRTAGATLALPFLDSMVPALTAQSRTAAVRRLGFVYVPHGVILNQWIPAASGPWFELPTILKPLEPYRDWLTVVTNLARPEERAQDHACTGAWLTGVAPKRTDGADFLAGKSIDQIVAEQVGKETTFPSLEVATEDFTAMQGACIPGFSCAYMNTLSWTTPTTPLPMETNPRAVFERMFGWENTREARLARMKSDHSVLDLINEDLADLQKGLGGHDRARLGEYVDYVREIERRIQRSEKQSEKLLTVPAAPVGIPESFEDHVDMLFELLALAYEADHTRVFTFMMNREFSQRTYPDLGVTEPHHAVSHNNGREPGVGNHVKVNTFHMQLFARFLYRLRETPDGDGSLLDHTTLLYGSGMGDGNTHTPTPLPLVVLGGERKPGGRHVITKEKTPLPNLLLTLADRTGVTLDRFGTSTGRVEI